METMNGYDETWIRHTGVSRIVGMAKSPNVIYVYFEVDAKRKELTTDHFATTWDELPLYLCIYDVTGVWFDGYNAPLVVQIRVPSDADAWYVNGLNANRNYVIDLATTTFENRLFSILRSDAVALPPLSTATNEPNVQFMATPKAMDRPARYPYEHEFDGYHVCEGWGDNRCQKDI